MIPHVFYIYSAIVWASFTRSVTFPLLVLALFNIAVYWPYLENSIQHANHENNIENIVNDADHAKASIHDMDHLRFDHLFYQFECTSYFILFGIVGYTLSQTVRFPPLLDTIYLESHLFYCCKVIGGILVYHAVVVPIFLIDSIFVGGLACCVLTLVWSIVFYSILVIEEIRWQTPKSIRTFIFYETLTLIFTTLAYTVARTFFVETQQHRTNNNENTDKDEINRVVTVDANTQWTFDSVILSIVIVDVVILFIVRSVLMKNRKLANITKLYADEKYLSIVHRRWFGITFQSTECDNGTCVVCLKDNFHVSSHRPKDADRLSHEQEIGLVQHAVTSNNIESELPITDIQRQHTQVKRSKNHARKQKHLSLSHSAKYLTSKVMGMMPLSMCMPSTSSSASVSTNDNTDGEEHEKYESETTALINAVNKQAPVASEHSLLDTNHTMQQLHGKDSILTKRKNVHKEDVVGVGGDNKNESNRPRYENEMREIDLSSSTAYEDNTINNSNVYIHNSVQRKKRRQKDIQEALRIEHEKDARETRSMFDAHQTLSSVSGPEGEMLSTTISHSPSPTPPYQQISQKSQTLDNTNQSSPTNRRSGSTKIPKSERTVQFKEHIRAYQNESEDEIKFV